MVKQHKVEDTKYEMHRQIATQTESLYFEINKLATKKPTERITPLIAKKINHVIIKIRELVTNDEFLDAIETIPVQGEQIRFDESLIILGELKGALDRQWQSKDFVEYRRANGLLHQSQVVR